MPDITLQTALDAIAREGFRDLADYDYISARVSNKLNLREQFYWSALQAVEKYLKAILLFNGQQIKDIGHYFEKVTDRIKNDTNVPLILDTEQLKLLRALEEFGNNRYGTRYTRIIGHELAALDNLVWTIRHYARNFNLEIDGVDKSEWHLQNFPPPNPATAPTACQLNDGELEKILSKASVDPLQQALVWCNKYYGESENATQVPTIVHASTHTPLYERDWFTKTTMESGKTPKEAAQEFVKFP